MMTGNFANLGSVYGFVAEKERKLLEVFHDKQTN
jgi:hypothetical protein